MEQHINKACDDLAKRIEELQYFLESRIEHSKRGISVEKLNQAGEKREDILELAIREAICELEKTKASFKSKKIKEVRKKLIEVIEKK